MIFNNLDVAEYNKSACVMKWTSLEFYKFCLILYKYYKVFKNFLAKKVLIFFLFSFNCQRNGRNHSVVSRWGEAV